MDFQEILQLADNLVVKKTGKHIDDLQKAILQGTWEGHKYFEIANQYQCSEGHVKDVGSELWKILSEELGEEVKKSNFRTTIERLQFSHFSSSFWKDFVHIGDVNLCSETSNLSESDKNESSVSYSNRKRDEDLQNIPDIGAFYGRTDELTCLTQWIFRDRVRSIGISGISGIGKTALVVNLVKQVHNQFDRILWRSLKFTPPLVQTLSNLLDSLTDTSEDRSFDITENGIAELLTYLRQHRCLLIFDDVEAILRDRCLVGYYKTGYENYGALFQSLAELSHKSCVIIMGLEPIREIASLTSECTPVRWLQLEGLGETAKELLDAEGLVLNEHWIKTIEIYRGHPFWLKSVATIIRDILEGNAADFFQYNCLLLTEEIKYQIERQWTRISDLEKDIIIRLARENDCIPLSQLMQERIITPSELLNIVQSLRRRSLLEQTGNLVMLPPVIKQYAKLRLTSANDL
jgi:hypothetical protein